MQVDLVGRVGRRSVLPAFMPIVGHGISKDGPRGVECRSRNGTIFRWLKRFEAGLGIFIPEC